MPLFLENYLGFVDSIREDAVIRCCIDPNAMYTPSGACDLGAAIANVDFPEIINNTVNKIELSGLLTNTINETLRTINLDPGIKACIRDSGNDTCKDYISDMFARTITIDNIASNPTEPIRGNHLSTTDAEVKNCT